MVDRKNQSSPSAQDVARRVIVLKHVVVCALTAPPREMLRSMMEHWSSNDRDKFTAEAEIQREQFWQSLGKTGVWTQLAPSERKLAQTTIVTLTDREQLNAMWRLESVQALMWALNLIPRLPPYDIHANSEILKQVSLQDVRRFVASAQLRAERELTGARDVAELWHWRSRTRQLIEEGSEFPVNERFHSFDEVVRLAAQNAAAEGRIPACIDGDFPAHGKAYRDLTDDEWSEVTSITIERHFATELGLRLRAKQSVG